MANANNMMVHPRIGVIGGRGQVAQLMVKRLEAVYQEVFLYTMDDFSDHLFEQPLDTIDLFVVCVDGFQSEKIVSTLQRNASRAKILDVSPAYRESPEWVYGLTHANAGLIYGAKLVANPGCFATAALILLQPLLDASIISYDQDLLISAIGGYTTGGHKLISKHESNDSGEPLVEIYNFGSEHRHISEIRRVTGLTGQLIITPIIGPHARGTHVHMIVPNTDRSLYDIFNTRYQRSNDIEVYLGKKTYRPDEMAFNQGARVFINQGQSYNVVTCQMDNLFKGAVSQAMDNIKLMLAKKEL